MSEGNRTSRRTVLKATGVTLGATAIGSLAYVGGRSTAAQESEFSPGRVWEYHETLLSVVQTSDGGYAAFGYEMHDGSYDIHLLKTDSQGEREWEDWYGGDGKDILHPDSFNASHARTLVNTSDGGFLFVFDSRVVKTDATGSVQWDTNLSPDETGSLLNGAFETADGEYAVAGRAPNNKAWYAQLDAGGNVVVERRYDRNLQRRWEFRSLVETSDGGFVFVGEKDAQAWVLKTDAAGNWQWEDVVTTADIHRNPFFWQDVIETPDGDIFAVGRAAANPEDTGTNALLLVDGTGNRRFLRTHEGSGHNLAVTPLVGGGYAVTGSDGEGSSLFKLDDAYTVVGHMTYPSTRANHPKGAEGWDVVQPGEGRYVLTTEHRLMEVSEDEERATKTPIDSPTSTARRTEPDTETDSNTATATDGATETTTATDDEDCKI